MKIRQNARHFASRKALELPVVSDVVKSKLVDMHTGIFLKKAEEGRREERKERLDAFFDATMDSYLAALQAGAPEAEAREITHIQSNFDFYNHGWTEMMEFPSDELEEHYERYETFFAEHDITIADPLGEFAPDEMPDAPSTPEKLDDPEHPFAEGGFADDVYVQGDDGEIRVGGQDEPENVDISDAVGVDEGEA
ncbi:DUF6149 family protein [Haladaptatus sp. T7]|uniref:DUF6149 family protein n=1 Tax=Haladaptatus sp. T7 TaxID=2029368 RepID=UPI0021A253FF|nr:DUF6149 family protein [Haladaptatus sp. T7]GKZ13002.1 hypothetical protein HAL_08830 [Haladaptatus sp. T7]